MTAYFGSSSALNPDPDADPKTRVAAVCSKEEIEALERQFVLYQSEALSLAFSISQNHAFAEDAVLRGMLAFWRSAFTGHSKHPRESLLLCVVRESRLLACSRPRGAGGKGKANARSMRRRGGVVLKATGRNREKDGFLTVVRSAFGALALPDRLLLALYFGLGLGQREIAQECGVLQSEVPERAERTVDKIKSLLGRVGLDAYSVDELSGHLPEAIRTGTEARDGMLERMRYLLQKENSRSQKSVTAGAGMNEGTLMGTLGLGALAAMVIVAAVWFSKDVPSDSFFAEPFFGAGRAERSP